MSIAIIGAGLIGRGWAIVFARAGYEVRVHDVSPEALPKAREALDVALDDLHVIGLLADPGAVLAKISLTDDLEHALVGATYVQECGPEDPDAKRALFAELDHLAPPETIIASSTSGILVSRFTDGLPGANRCLVAHPVNPPYLVPLVELAPGPATSNEIIASARALLAEVGQVPITVRREIEGFILNRLQGTLLNESLRLVEGGYVSVEDLDRTVKNGLGLRWSFMGPFETIDLNAPGGVVDYANRYGPLYTRMTESQSVPPDWSEPAITEVLRQRRAHTPQNALSERQQWRDRRLMALIAHQREMNKNDENQE